ncbi:MAG: Arm DNA-binding domain-containing protein [Pseudomonadota bacterium]
MSIGDGGGLYLEVQATGQKVWRMAYRRGLKVTKISFGAYPAVSLTEARRCRDDARRLIEEGIDPVAQRREKEKREREGQRLGPKLRMSMSADGSLTIEKPTGRITLNQAQVAALRSFLNATSEETDGASICRN